MADSPSVTDWISAISTAGLGLVGLSVTVWQWRRSGFRPKIAARIDGQHEAIEVLVVNQGRAGGIINHLDVANPDGRVHTNAIFNGFPDGAFRPLALAALATMRIIIEAPEQQPFSAAVMIIVDVGGRQPATVTPSAAAPGLGIFGLNSVLPPSAIG
jgi:hypothetical protein